MYYLSKAQKQEFEQNGYLVIPNFFTLEKAKQLKSRAEELLDNFSLEDHPRIIFSTDDKQIRGDYFLNSGDKVRFFFEEEAFDESGKLLKDKSKAINKIGHALHELEPEFKEFSINESIRQVSIDLGFKEPKILQSMLIFKQPFIGGGVSPHQDSTFLYTEPLSAIGFWFALEDCKEENGCLWFLPGSHKTHPISKRFVRSENKNNTEFVKIDNEVPIDQSKFVKEETKAGTLVLIHGSVVHKSEANRSPYSRFIYTFHAIEGTARYDEKNWLQPTPEMPFSSLN